MFGLLEFANAIIAIRRLADEVKSASQTTRLMTTGSQRLVPIGTLGAAALQCRLGVASIEPKASMRVSTSGHPVALVSFGNAGRRSFAPIERSSPCKVGEERLTDNAAGHLDEYLDQVLIGGRESREITIVDYDPVWPTRFAHERSRIGSLGRVAKRIEHIGSTAVPGLAAKPIIDILVTVQDVEDECSYMPTLEAAGYVLRVREPRHRMFRTPNRDVHIHVWQSGSEEERRYLLFRNWLRSNAPDRELYERTKRELSQRSWTDMNYYAEAKGAVVAAILERAARGASAPDAAS